MRFSKNLMEKIYNLIEFIIVKKGKKRYKSILKSNPNPSSNRPLYLNSIFACTLLFGVSNSANALSIALDGTRTVISGTDCGIATYRFGTTASWQGTPLDIIVTVNSEDNEYANGNCVEATDGILSVRLRDTDSGDNVAFVDTTITVVEQGTTNTVLIDRITVTGFDLDHNGPVAPAADSTDTDDIYLSGPDASYLSSSTNVEFSTGSFTGGHDVKFKGQSSAFGDCADTPATPVISCRAAATWTGGAGVNSISTIHARFQNDNAYGFRSPSITSSNRLLQLSFIDSHAEEIMAPNTDYGDAPTSYGSASHTLLSLQTILGNGLAPDHDASNQPTVNAMGDDNDVSAGNPFYDDEDAVRRNGALLDGQHVTPSENVSIDVTTFGTGYLSAWMDLNINGDFADAGEQLLTDVFINSTTVENTNLVLSVPYTATGGDTYLRFRFSESAGASFSGSDTGGEVEDYRIIVDPLSPSYNMVKTSNGPIVGPGPLTYTFTFTNTGNVVLNDLTVTDPDIDSGTLTDCPIATLAVGASASCTATRTITQMQVDAGTDISNTATPTAEDPADNPVAEDDVTDNTVLTSIAPSPPYSCNATEFLQFFERVPDSGNFEIGELDLVTGNYNTQFTFTKQLNALGYSISDNYLYGAEINGNKNLHRVDADGSLIDLGVNLPFNIFSGDVDDNNVWHGFRGTQVFKVDIDNLSLTTENITDVTDVADFAFSDFHTLFFGVKSNSDGSIKELYTYNPVTNAVTTSPLTGDILTVGGGAFGGTWADASGNIYTSHNASGKVFVVDVATGGTTELILSVAGIKKNDGMSCSLAAGPSTPANITLSKSLTAEDGSIPDVVEPGEILTYTVTLSNSGGTDGIIIIDETVPTGTTVVAAGNDFIVDSCSNGAVAGTLCSLDSPNVPAGGTASMTFKVQATDPLTTTSIENLVIENGTTPPTCTAADDTDTRCVSTPTSGSISIIKSLGSITDTNTDTVTNAGDTITYNFTVTNTGGLVLNPVSVSDTKIATVTCAATSLAVGASTTCSGDYIITSVDMSAGGVENIATATGTPKNPDGSDGTPVTDLSDAGTASDGSTINNPETVETPNPLAVNPNNVTDPTDDPTTVTLTPQASISIVKSLGSIADTNTDSVTNAGDTITYNFIVTNTGDLVLNPISVSDTKIGTVTCVATSLAVGVNTTCSGDYVISAADMSAGGVENIATATGTPKNLNGSDGTPVTDLSDAGTTPDGTTINNPETVETPNPLGVNSNNVADPTDDPTTVLLVETGVVAGTIYEDTNGNGTQDPGESGIANVTVNITDVSSNPHILTTDNNGNYAAQVPAGNTVINIDETTLPSGFTQTEGTDPTTVTVPVDGIGSDVDGYEPPANAGTVNGLVYEDTNGNGSQDVGEPGIAGVTVTVTDSSSGTQILTTDSNGAYSATVPAGNTIIDIDETSLPGGSTQTEGTNSTTVTVPSGGTASDVDGYQPPVNAGTVNGVVYNDVNGNGTQDVGEPGIAGVTVIITDSASGAQTLTTDSSGAYSATVPAGSTIIDIDETSLPGGSTQTEGTDSTTVTVPAGGTTSDVDGYQPVGSQGNLSGIVYEDTNGNGSQDAGEPGIPGVDVTVTDSAASIQILVTDANGEYSTIVPAGTTLVDIEQSDINASYTQTEGTDPTTVTVPAGGTGTDVDGFNPPPTGVVAGTVYEDTNGNGTQDPGEPGIQNVTVNITDSNSNPHVLVTDNNGNYATQVPSGNTGIDIDETTLPTGFTQTEGTDPTTVTVPAGDIASDVDGYQPPANAGTVSGVVYEDTNGNGTQDIGEPGIAGVAVTITDSSSGTQTLTTDSNGAYSATVPAGNTIIDIDDTSLPGGSVQTEGTDTTTVTVPAGGTANDADGYQPPANAGTVNGVVYNDINGNGSQDAGEPGIAGVTVTITDSAAGVQTLTTDSNGAYTATVPAGNTVIDIDENSLPGASTQTEGTDSTTVTVPTGGTASDVDGYQPSVSQGTLEGIVYEDTNGNGTQDTGEPGIPGVDVTVTDSGSSIQTLVTDVNGEYSTVVPAGTTLVDIEQSDIDASFTQTEGTDPTTVTVPAGGIGRDVDGFNPPVAGIQGTVWLDANKDGLISTGEPRLGNWTLVIRDLSGAEVARTTTDSNGDYSVAGLAPVEYTVDFLNPAGVFIRSLSTNGPLPAGSTINLPLPIDPSGVVYDSTTRAPIAGVTLQLLNGGVAVDPSCVFPGQQNQTTLADGIYAFDVIPAAHPSCPDGSTYEISIINTPTAYSLSTTLPPVAAIYDGAATEGACTVDAINASGSCEVQAQGNPPTGGQPTTYYTQFLLTSGDLNIIFNHIPLDPGATGTLLLNKKANKSEASTGDLVMYTIESENQLASALTDIDIRDNLPGGFKLVGNSARVIRTGPDSQFDTADDVITAATVSGNDPVTFEDIDFAANETVQIRYVLRVGSGVVQGNAINRAQAFDPSGPALSNEAQATVVIVADPLFDKSTVIGKVFHDRDQDGYQDNAKATDITITSEYFGEDGYNAGDLAGRISALDSLEDYQLVVRMPYQAGNNNATITTAEGTVIKVDETGNFSEQHTGLKAKGMTGQDLRVTVQREQGIATAVDGQPSTGAETDVLTIRITNHGVNEEGLPGVRLATVTGLLIETDAYGRYHVPDVDGGNFNRGRNFILKVDPATLPNDSVFTTENPRVLRISSAALNRINFGVYLPQQQALQQSGSSVVIQKSVNVTLGSVFFDLDKSNIREDQRGVIDTIVAKLREYGTGHIVIEAHTDARNTAEYNIALAKRRAVSVRKMLEVHLGPALMTHINIDVAPESNREIPHGDPDAPDYHEEDGLLDELSSMKDGLSDTIQKLAMRVIDYVIGTANAGDVVEANAGEDKPTYTLEVISFGEGKPKAENMNEQGLQENRRVDISMTNAIAKQSAANTRVSLPDGGVIWLTSDPANSQPRLSINAPSLVKMYDGKLERPVSFNIYSNYSAFIDRWEIDLYLTSGAQVKPVKRIQGNQLTNTQVITWEGSLDDDNQLTFADYSYVLRVYDKAGRFDETAPAILRLGNGAQYDTQDVVSETQEAANEIYGESQLIKQTIPLAGSLVRVYGSDLPEGQSLNINGETVAIDSNRNFVVESILPAGTHDFDIAVSDAEGNAWNKKLTTEVTDKYFFMVGIADVTIGQNEVSGSIEPLAVDDRYDEDVFVDGRLAFYLKGKVKGKYLITAQMDTEEDDIEEIFKDIHKKDPRSVFRRLDPDRYYPVYGDDSNIIDDTDSQGKMYVRVEWDKSQALWGNYNTSLTGTELSEFNRSLYGAQYIHRNLDTTTFGDHKTEAQLFASEVQSALAHNEFLGTGGSLYYLKHTDILPGSEKLWVEVRQRETERVIEKIVLERGRDYEVDEIQGRIILSRPLTQVSALTGPSIIKDTPLDGNQVFLAADYEYVPDDFSADKATYGARGKAWVTDNIAVGGSYVHENRSSEDYELKGVDITLKAAEGTYFKAEYAESEAEQTAANFVSTDGGLNFNPVATATGAIDGSAISLEARADLEDITENGKGSIGAWWKDRESGYSTARLSSETTDTTEYGVEAIVNATNNLDLSARVTRIEKEGVSEDSTASLEADYRITDKWQVGAEVRYIENEVTTGTSGEGTLAGVLLSHQFNPDMTVYGKAQTTLDNSGSYEDNDLVTLGAEASLAKSLRMKAEASTGDRGDGGLVGLDYALNETHSLYGTYSLSTDTTHQKRGIFTVGQRKALSNQMNVYTEHQYTHEDDRAGLGNTFGLDYRLNRHLSASGSLQTASLEDTTGDITDRDAISLGISYDKDRTRASTRVEFRKDEGPTIDEEQWLTSNNINYLLNPSWRLQGKLNYSQTESQISGDLDAKFAEVGVGFAYRPVDYDRLNLLGRLTGLYDLRPLSQSSDPDERATVASIEGTYDLNQRWELGSKLAYKKSEIRLGRDQGEWIDNDASLAALRVRYHMIKNWDGMAEYHWLNSDASDDLKHGALLTVYRHVGDHFKVGVGYNFTDFNDDLVNQDYDASGWFINLIGKY